MSSFQSKNPQKPEGGSGDSQASTLDPEDFPSVADIAWGKANFTTGVPTAGADPAFDRKEAQSLVRMDVAVLPSIEAAAANSSDVYLDAQGRRRSERADDLLQIVGDYKLHDPKLVFEAARLLNELKDISPDYQIKIESLLVDILSDPETDPLVLLGAAEGVQGLTDQTLVTKLLENLDEADLNEDSVRLGANITALARTGNETARGVLRVIALHDDSAYVRGKAFEALVPKGDPKTLRVLRIGALTDPDAGFKALHNLQQERDQDTVEVLMISLKSEDARFQLAASQALEGIDDEAVVDRLIQLLTRINEETPEGLSIGFHAMAALNDTQVERGRAALRLIRDQDRNLLTSARADQALKGELRLSNPAA